MTLLTSEVRTGPVPFSSAYTYDHNGNRLTQTQNGSPFQSFGYDAHDKLVSGTAGSETPGYDANGSETGNTLNGQHTSYTYDDEDRLTSATTPGGVTDTFVYNGLGLRVSKTDSTGTYPSNFDGTSPGSPLLSDDHALYTPGLSESRGGVSSYYSFDEIGNLWTVNGSGKSQSYYQDTSAFGGMLAASGTASAFGYGGENGCQSDADTGLILMGHRYYDSRIGRFISQDPAHDGRNWYEYASNNPTNKTDPTGLSDGLPGSLGAPDQRYGGAGGLLDGGAENFNDGSLDNSTSNLDGSWFNQRQQQDIAAYVAQENASFGLTSGSGPTSCWVFNIVGPSASISLGPVHFDGNIGIAIQGPGLGATGWGLETFGSVNAGLGIGLGISVSSGKLANLGSFGFGLGNLNGFNGGSWFGTILAQPFTGLTYSQAMGGGYKGIQVGLPLGGIDVGLYGGAGYTLPIFSTGHKN